VLIDDVGPTPAVMCKHGVEVARHRFAITAIVERLA
jgi:hypothetical protein